MTRIAIVGAGAMGNVHAEAGAALPGVAVTWVVDQDAARADALAAKLGARATADTAEAVAAPDVDAVVVTVPTPYHRPLTELAAAHGKHVFCEKPIALTGDDGRAMVEVCAAAGVRLMVGHVVRFFPEYVRMRELLAADEIGQVGVVRASRLNQHPKTARSWYGSSEASGGVIVDMMIHDLDTLRWYFGEVERVYAHGLSIAPDQPTTDYAVALVRFARGVVAHVEASWAHTSFRTAIEIAGEHGIIRHASEESAAIRLERTAPSPMGKTAAGYLPRAGSPYRAELAHFARSLEEGTPFLVDGEDAVRSLEVALAVREAVRTGRPVPFAGGRPQLSPEETTA